MGLTSDHTLLRCKKGFQGPTPTPDMNTATYTPTKMAFANTQVAGINPMLSLASSSWSVSYLYPIFSPPSRISITIS